MPSATLELQHVNSIITHCEPKINYPNIDAILRQQSAYMVQKRLNLIYQQCGQAHNSAFFHTQGYRASIMQQQAQNQALALEKIQELSWQLWRIHQHFFSQHSILGGVAQLKNNALLSQCRAQLMTFKSQIATDCWQDNGQAKPIAIDWSNEQLELWHKHIYQPLKSALTQQQWASQLYTPQEILTQFESGPSVRQGQQNPNIIDRLNALWLELQQARTELITPTPYSTTPYSIIQRKDGVVDAVRGELRHQITWHQNRVEQYRITVPTIGIINSLSRSVIGLDLSIIDNDLSIFSLWVLTHFPCMEVSLQLHPVSDNDAINMNSNIMIENSHAQSGGK